MEGYLPNKDLIFFNPGHSGVVYIHPAKYYITLEQLIDAQECLTQETNSRVAFVENRRTIYRRQEDTSIYSSFRGKRAKLRV